MSETLEVDQRVATAREFVARVFNGHDRNEPGTSSPQTSYGTVARSER
jgi:hypothetical protein